jgi:hypothetical protein
MNLFDKLFLVGLLLPFFSIAQSNFQPGVIVTLKGDTLHGFVNYTGFENNPKTITFKEGATGNITKHSANDISYFAFTIGHLEEYRRYEGAITMDKVDVDNVSVERDSSIRIDTVFLRVIQKGKNLVLYSYADKIKTRFFISNNFNDAPTELIYRVYFNNLESTRGGRTVYESTYKEQLYSAGVKFNVMDAAFKKQIQKADYADEDLINIAGKINGISDAEVLKNGLPHPKPYKFILASALFVVIAILVFEKR